MSRAKSSKKDEYTEENLVGKSIVDPNGHIIAKCVGLFEDDRKRVRLRIAIETDIGSDFIVKETIPSSLISNIGEVILLKKSFEIKPVIIEDIVSFEISDSTKMETKDKKSILDRDDSQKKNDEIKQEVEKIDGSNILNLKQKALEKITEIKQKERPIVTTSKILTEQKSKGKKDLKKVPKKKLTVEEHFQLIKEAKDEKSREPEVEALIKQIARTKTFRKKAMKFLLQEMQSPNLQIRKIIAQIFREVAENDIDHLKPYFIDILTSAYSEPSKEVEQIILDYLKQIVTSLNSEILDSAIDKFLTRLILKRNICKTVSLNRIHSLNLKIFMNNYSVQELICNKYLLSIIKKPKDPEEIAELLKDYHAIVIAYTILNNFKPEKWLKILSNKSIKTNFEEHFINTIEDVITYFKDGNIKKLNEMIDPKIGKEIANKILRKMIKFRLNDYLTNMSVLPLDIVTTFFNDEDNLSIQIIFDLINKNEIKAQVIFIDDKIYFSLREE